MALILASASPRRRELLGLLTHDFEVRTVDVDESGFDEPTPAALAGRLAAEKCRAAAALWPQDCVIGSDTVVEADGLLLGKPKDPADARRMLRLLSGGVSLVHTGVCIREGGREECRVETTTVRFAPIPEEDIESYIRTDEPYDKAGGYGIQGWAARHITGIDGCFYNVMGLPVRTVYDMLRTLGRRP